MTRAEAAGHLWGRIITLVDELGEDDWSRGTPCAGWDVRDLLGHLSGTQVMFDAGTAVPPPPGWEPPAGAAPLDAWTEVGVAARRGWDRARLRAELEQARDGHVARLEGVTDWSAPAEGPVGPTTEDGLLQVRMFDLWVHLQDLHEALGRPADVDDASRAAAMAHRHVIDRVPYLFVKRAGAQEHATMRVRLGAPVDLDTVVEVAGGRGRFNPDADPGACAVEGSPGALTLLVAGRHDAAHWSDRGVLTWSGSRAEEFVERARFF
jgi:uncharacterized protein (TIGR03083 family)